MSPYAVFLCITQTSMTWLWSFWCIESDMRNHTHSLWNNSQLLFSLSVCNNSVVAAVQLKTTNAGTVDDNRPNNWSLETGSKWPSHSTWTDHELCWPQIGWPVGLGTWGRPLRPGNPALCGFRPVVTLYYCRLGDLLCFVFISSYCMLDLSVYYLFLQYFDTVGWVFWPVKTVSHMTYTVLAGT